MAIRRHHSLLLSGLVVVLGLSVGCSSAVVGDGGGWTAALVTRATGFEVPECVVVDPADGAAYVSNIQSEPSGYWADDGRAFISRLRPGGEIDTLEWQTGAPDHRLHAPKGLCILNGVLYAADNTVVARIRIADNTPMDAIPIVGAEHLNDMAAHGDSVYLSDTQTGRVFRLTEGGDLSEIPAPASANGVTFSGDRMLCVSWDLHDLYELDPSGANAPRAFGLAGYFTNLDAIEVLEDGSYLVSDFVGGKVCVVSPDGTSVRTIIRLDSPADVGLDRERGFLYIPQLNQNAVAVYQLARD